MQRSARTKGAEALNVFTNHLCLTIFPIVVSFASPRPREANIQLLSTIYVLTQLSCCIICIGRLQVYSLAYYVSICISWLQVYSLLLHACKLVRFGPLKIVQFQGVKKNISNNACQQFVRVSNKRVTIGRHT